MCKQVTHYEFGKPRTSDTTQDYFERWAIAQVSKEDLLRVSLTFARDELQDAAKAADVLELDLLAERLREIRKELKKLKKEYT